MGKGTGALELTENGFFVCEKVTNEAVIMAFVHRQRGFYAGTKNTRGKNLGEQRNEGFVGRSQFNETGKMCCYCVECGDIRKAELAKGVLQNRDAGF